MKWLPEKGASLQKKTHYWLTVFFLVQIPVALGTGIKESLPYIVFLSQWALVASHWTAFLAAPNRSKQ